MNHHHGGTDALGVPQWDFSTNANACGPCPVAMEAVRRADPRHYPDPSYADLRATLAGFHGVAAERIVLAGSASEFIVRLTGGVRGAGGRSVWLPRLAYGDYGRAAEAWGLLRADQPEAADLLWLCEPASPVGAAEALAKDVASMDGVVVLDRAYEPLRLSGRCSLDADALDRVWQLWSPNKALGMTGVRGAYAIAPLQGLAMAGQLTAMAPSWPLGSHAVAMLLAWTQADVQLWVVQSREQLGLWKCAQIALLKALGWDCLPSEANYFCAQPPVELDASALRAVGVKLRETTSLGLADHWRLGVRPPDAQAALRAALTNTKETTL
ncbi:aminotransferase [Hydrogenophaga crassostreae]|uniref:histidinol-phosphate transaminase n=1 Tax=Hydrogenophaga crassostreae TaxID=1763535 RepID=A0A162P1L1_9BURK|nr:aminotransferase class I/II-fold pyridoxal phosphate-dependent enzyme [Hydrogenophaga crassostreae]AOW13063.1 aminotransferase [Hydrogenophaga crassostreae]OAD40247.1 aminotransferase [Hydrogenophaga crassostreae]